MARTAVNLTEWLRPWRESGIESLLLEPSCQSASPSPSLDSDPTQWPEPWPMYWQRVVSPSTTVWTYWLLANDLGPDPNPVHKQFFQQIIQGLGWPRGSITFWPLTVPQGKDLVVEVDRFLSGVSLIQATTIISFGSELQELLPLCPGPHERVFLLEDLTVVLLPDLSSLLSQIPGVIKGFQRLVEPLVFSS